MDSRKPNLPGSAPDVLEKAIGEDKPQSPVPKLHFSLHIDTHLHPRSATMRRHLAEYKWNVTPKNGKTFLDDQYLIVDGTSTDFSSTDMASIGSKIHREVIILNPKSPLLEKHFATLKDSIEKFKREHIATDNDIFRLALRHTKSALLYDEAQTAKIISAEVPNDPNKPRKIPLDFFLEHGIGVCRHQAFFLAYLFDRLIKEKYLPSYLKVYSHRDNAKDGAHTWVIVKNELTDELFYLDPTCLDTALNLRKLDEREKIVALLGEDAITRCIQRYAKAIWPYKQIKDEKDKHEFLFTLLEPKKIIRLRIFLQLQQAEDSLVQIEHDFKLNEAFKKNNNYKLVLAEIARIKRVNQVTQFSEIQDVLDKMQFLIILIIKKPEERKGILENQTLSSLKMLAATLDDYSHMLEEIKIELPFYDDLQKDIHTEYTNKKAAELIKINFLKKVCLNILNTITQQKLTVESATNCCCSLFSPAPGKEITVGQFKRRIPTEAHQYYDILTKVKLDEASLEELNAILQKINAAAEKSAKKAEDPNQSFYKILEMKNYRRMLADLEGFNQQRAHLTLTLQH